MTSVGPPSPVATAAKVAAELGELFRPVGQFLKRRNAEVVTAVAVLVTALVVFAVAGAALDDRAISKNQGVAEATVLDGSTFMRTLVRFTAANGDTVVPAGGVDYPRGLQPGQQVTVEYDVTHPDSVRVAGRSAFGQAGPLALLAVGVWVVLGSLAHWLRKRRRQQGRSV